MNSDTQRYDIFTESRKREEAEKKGREKRMGYSTAKRNEYQGDRPGINPPESGHDRQEEGMDEEASPMKEDLWIQK